jgi:hypothetical protein
LKTLIPQVLPYIARSSFYTQGTLIMSTAAATLATMQEEDGSEDVNDFLRRIRELDDQRNREDEERTRKLQEELLKGRQEREARRAGECAYVPSISATHTSIPNATIT